MGFLPSILANFLKVPNYGPRQPQGRLTCLRSVILRFDPNESYMVSQLGGDPDPKSTWTEWTEQFLNSRLHDLRFPSLKELTLDFLKMKVDENEGFRVSLSSTTYITGSFANENRSSPLSGDWRHPRDYKSW